MVLVEVAGYRILYTGDFRLGPSATAEPCQPVEADVLIMECTFGDPRYRFPDRDGVVDDLCTFVEETLAMEAAPVLVAYSLGKAQEIASLMSARGFSVALHPRGWAMLETYRELGVTIERCTRYAMGPLGRGVLIVPPGKVGRALASRLHRRRTALISGWTLRHPDRPGTRFGRYDAGFPISDHADYGELLEMIRRVRPRRIYTLHGAPLFAERLRARGHDAWPAHAPSPPLPRARARQMQLL
jgi:Cft2 family RNA processing exonuclease